MSSQHILRYYKQGQIDQRIPLLTEFSMYVKV